MRHFEQAVKTSCKMRRSDLKPAMRPYEPFGACQKLFYNRSEEILLSGPAGTGKSRGCLEKLHACMEKWPGARALIVRKTRASLTESALVTFEEKVLPEGHAALQGPQRRFRQAYRYPNGSEIIVGGLDNATKVMSTEYDVIYVQEAIETAEDDWEKLSTRLRNGVMPFQQLIGDTNPDRPQHWLKLRCDKGITLLLESRHEDNPTLWDAARGEWTPQGAVYIARLERLTGARYWRLRHGRWVAAEGPVYEDWDRNIHLKDRFPIPAEWRRFRAIDFGYKNPFVCQWWVIDPDDRMYLYREIYVTGRLVRDLGAEIVRLSAGERIEATVADHDAEDRATLDAAGVPTSPAWKSVSPGIQAVQQRLKVGEDKRAGLYILRDSLVERDESLAEESKPVCTEQEIDGYVWPKGADGKAVKEEPVKLDDHGMDTMRYAVAYADHLGGGWATDPRLREWMKARN